MLHIINIILSIGIGILGFILMLTQHNTFLELIAGCIALIMSICGIFMSLFSEKLAQKLFPPFKEVRKGWEPVVILIWGLFEAFIGIFVLVGGTPINQKLMIGILVLTGILFLTSILWKVKDNKKMYGQARLKPMLIIILLIIGILSICVGIGYIITKQQWKNQLGVTFVVPQDTDSPKSSDKKMDSDLYTKTQLSEKLNEDFDGQKLYYSLQNPNDEQIHLILWNDTEENVYIYILEKAGEESYQIQTTMLSQSLTYKDVKGKEQGVIE